jgi:transcriptional regulator with GAF, ATPase, and Fis domain
MSFRASETQLLGPEEPDDAEVSGLRLRGSETIYPLAGERPRWVIGAGPSCDIVLRDRFVSSTHCVIERRASDRALIVRDRKSRNGTRVDGHPIEGAVLRVGATLEVGRTALVAVAAPAARRPSALEAVRGADPVLRRAVEQAARIAGTECSVLIVGETGTGKELIARLIHDGSPRRGGPLVAVNCGAISRELIAAELFGHERGAYTGAHGERDGYFVEAHGGTLFLDELGELPLTLQPNLLRALETRRVRRLGGNAERAVDVRVIAATNRVDVDVDQTHLRRDLYHRVATVLIRLPPLRERRRDLPELVGAMLDEVGPVSGPRTVSAEAWAALEEYGWPGNVRELRQAVQRAVVLGGAALGPQDFFPDRPLPPSPPPPQPATELPLAAWRPRLALSDLPRMACEDASLRPYLARQRELMAEAIAEHKSIRAAAKALGMPKSTFCDRARVWGLLTEPPPGTNKG